MAHATTDFFSKNKKSTFLRKVLNMKKNTKKSNFRKQIKSLRLTPGGYISEVTGVYLAHMVAV